MDKWTILLGSVLLAVALPLYADISNTNSVTWNGGANTINTSYNWTGDPVAALGLQVTVDAGYQFNFDSLGIFIGFSGAGSGGAPSPYLQIVDSLDNILATTPSVLMTTPVDGFYDIASRSDANPYEMTFTATSTVSLSPGTYNFLIWDTGEQLNFMMSGGAVSISGVSVTMGTPYSGVDAFTPAFEMGSSFGPVPEPSTYALMGLGVIGLYLARRDRLGNR